MPASADAEIEDVMKKNSCMARASCNSSDVAEINAGL